MLQAPQVLGSDHNKPHSLMSDPISTMYFHNMSCDLLNKILFKPTIFRERNQFYLEISTCDPSILKVEYPKFNTSSQKEKPISAEMVKSM